MERTIKGIDTELIPVAQIVRRALGPASLKLLAEQLRADPMNAFLAGLSRGADPAAEVA